MSARMGRRAWLTASLFGLTAGCTRAPWVRAARTAPDRFAVPLRALDGGGPVLLDGLDAPVLLSVTPQGEPVAVELVCAHRGCAVGLRRDRLVCPCHGSVFTLQGGVVEGPASAPLRRLSARVEGEALIIATKEPG